MGSSPEVFRQVLAHLARGPERTVLDAPAGHGALASLLADRGYDVRACDILPELFEAGGVECLAGNLNERLPYDDGSFDAVTSCNGIHRVVSVGHSISEYARVLRPGGRLFITVPNFTKLSRRIRFLLYGVSSWAAVRSANEVDDPEAHHRRPVSLTEILIGLQAAGLELRGVRGLGLRASGVFLVPLALPVRLWVLSCPAQKRRKYFLEQTASLPALLSDFHFIEARKPGLA
ncbi:MAG TPA: class I SAM-dependent methyltransferase [Candidatus Polarisedimenticolaceae bacterium]|nr:class I SAM-dependent methyltransferase [Candidatus Polarisedimenticolaceae bacterium]